MKQILLIFLIVLGINANAQNNVQIKVNNFTVAPGGQSIDVPVTFSYPSDSTYTMVQFDIALPEGFSINDSEDYKPYLSTDMINVDRRGDKSHTLSYNKVESGNYRFIISNNTQTAFKSNDGTLMYITIDADANMAEGTYSVKVSNGTVTNKALSNVTLAECESTATVSKSTGIYAIKSAATTDGRIYNAAGQMQSHAEKGLNIINGKKYVVR